MSRYGASTFSSLLKDCVLWAPLQHSAGVSGDIDEFPIIPSGVTVTNNGTFTKTDLGNNKSVLNFDGSTNYISLTDNDAWDIHLSSFSVFMWVKLTSNATCALFHQKTDMNNVFMVTYNASESKIYVQRIITGSINGSWIIDHTIGANTWYCISISRTGTANPSIYVNGISKSVTVTKSQSDTTTVFNGPFIIGLSRAGTTYYPGSMKDLMIFKGRALTQPEIKLLMNRTHPETGAGLMPSSGEYYRLS